MLVIIIGAAVVVLCVIVIVVALIIRRAKKNKETSDIPLRALKATSELELLEGDKEKALQKEQRPSKTKFKVFHILYSLQCKPFVICRRKAMRCISKQQVMWMENPIHSNQLRKQRQRRRRNTNLSTLNHQVIELMLKYLKQ